MTHPEQLPTGIGNSPSAPTPEEDHMRTNRVRLETTLEDLPALQAEYEFASELQRTMMIHCFGLGHSAGKLEGLTKAAKVIGA